MGGTSKKEPMGRGLFLLMAIVVAATVSNLYYNQPLLPSIGMSLGVDRSALGLIPSATQIGYATAIFFISPLGDTMDRKMLIRYLSIILSIGLLVVYFSPGFWVLVAAALVVGIGSNITQQLLPFAASLSTPETRGRVIATLMTGLTLGILLSRTLSGVVAEHFGWRAVFLMAAGIAICFGVLLNLFLPNSKPSTSLSYPRLLWSMFILLKTQPLLREAAFTGALWFAAFNALWATLAIHVAEAPFFFTVQQAGFFGFLGVAGILGAKISGRMVNRLGPKRLITVALLLIAGGFAVMLNWGDTLTGLIAGIILADLGVFGAQIPNQVRVFSIDPDAQSRMNAVYMLFYYLGGALGSAFGVKVIGSAGWSGLTIFAMALLAAALLNHFLSGASQKNAGRK